MKKLTILAAVSALAICATSCDFVRSIAGRPTSDELAQADEFNEEEEFVEYDETEEADSLCCEQEPCDTCGKACCETEEAGAEVEQPCEKPCEEAKPCEEKPCEAAPAPVAQPAPVAKPKPAPVAKPKAAPKKSVRIFTGPVCKKAALENKYYVLIGTFKVESNAAAQVKRAEKAGYKAVTIPFANCLTAVAVNPTDSQKEALKTLEEVKGKKFCPKDAYVLVVK